MAWDCVCGATGIEAPYCAWCGRWAPVQAPAYPQQVPPYDPYAAYQPPPLRQRRYGGAGAVVGGAIAASVALVVALGAIGYLADIDTAPSVPTQRTAPTEAPRRTHGTTTHSAQFTATVAGLKAFVERTHGGAFRHDVTIETLSDRDFAAVVAGSDDGDDPFSDTLTGLGLAGGEDPDAVRADVLANGVDGLYDHTEDVLYVRGERTTPYARLILVHELTHAWQDQTYDLDAVFERAESLDAGQAVEALVEGDATRVETLWERAQPADVRAALDREREGTATPGTADESTVAEESTTALLGFSYSIGESFVNALAKVGGNTGIDAAFKDPPVSTEQVMHPARYLAGEVPQVLSGPAPPDSATEQLDAGTLGEAGLAVFAGHGRPDRDALAAVDGWDGDSYVTWRDHGLVCTQDDVAMDTAAARDRLLRRLRGLDLGTGGRVEPVGARRLSVVSCATA